MGSRKNPLISIITPTFNRADTLPTAIESVFSQGIDDIEYLIMDGGSTDNTREIVAKYPKIRFYSEPDEGLYHALNKGIQLAKGNYIGWLNSDDLYPPNTFVSVMNALEENTDWAAVFGNAEFRNNEPPYKSILIPGFQDNSFLLKVTSDSHPINAGFFKREVFHKLGFFNTSYKVASDLDFLFRFGLAGFPYGYINRTFYVYQESPTSLTFSNNLNGKITGVREEMKIAKNLIPTNNNSDIKNICITWHSKASADAVLLCTMNGMRKEAKAIRNEGLKLDPQNWRKFFFRGLFMFYARKFFSPQIRAHFRKFKKPLGYYSDHVSD